MLVLPYMREYYFDGFRTFFSCLFFLFVLGDEIKISDKSGYFQDGSSEVNVVDPKSDAAKSSATLRLVADVACILDKNLNLEDLAPAAIASPNATSEDAVNIIIDVLSNLGGAEKSVEAE
ncbi:hypothetical protein D1007_43222 [Hordeum vulgare]|nr:hypothetical protein D1007_43222 [Hordeum vulgare]